MLLFIPVLVGLVVGGFILLLTRWCSNKGFSLLVRISPGIIGVLTAVILFYISFVQIRGFEGAAYGILALFLSIFSAVSILIGKKSAWHPNN